MDCDWADNALTVGDFVLLRQSVGWEKPSERQAEIALKNSLFTVAVFHRGQAIGMGRLVGDGAMICYLQDVIVLPEHQQKGIGAAIVKRLVNHARENGLADTRLTIGLFAAKGKEEFYGRLGFSIRPNERRGAGMEMTLKTTQAGQ